MRAKKAARFLIPLFPFLAVLYLLFPRLSQPADPAITALAPVEVVAEGQQELVGVAVAPDGTVYFSDRMGGVVYRLQPGEALATVLTGLHRPAGLALDAEGRLLIVEEMVGKSFAMSPTARSPFWRVESKHRAGSPFHPTRFT